MPFFLTAPTDPATPSPGNPPGSTAAWSAGSSVFPFVILEAGIDTIPTASSQVQVATTTVLDDASIILATIRGVPDTTAFGVTAVNSGGDLTLSVSNIPAVTAADMRVSWVVIGPPTP